jgi:hypothetical protein
MSADETIGLDTEFPVESEVLRLESSNSVWFFEIDRMRFRRVPRGTDPGSLALANDWQPYFGLEVESGTGAFTVALNEAGTRRLRAVKVEAPAPDDHTTEISLRPESV